MFSFVYKFVFIHVIMKSLLGNSMVFVLRDCGNLGQSVEKPRVNGAPREVPESTQWTP